MKCFIISQPKAGTYLCANLLSEFGLGFDGYHISPQHYQKHDIDNLDQARKNRRNTKTKSSLAESLHLIKENYFGVGHLEHTDTTEELLTNFKKILLLRDLETSKQSWHRWAKAQGKSLTTYNLNKKHRQGIANWQNKSSVYTLDFFDLKNRNKEKIEHLQLFLFGKVMYDSFKCIDNALNRNSFTKV